MPSQPIPEPIGATVLVADDDSSVRSMVQLALRRRGHAVIVAAGAVTAVALAGRRDRTSS